MVPLGGRSIPGPDEKSTFVYNIQGVSHWKIDFMRVFSIFKNLEKKLAMPWPRYHTPPPPPPAPVVSLKVTVLSSFPDELLSYLFFQSIHKNNCAIHLIRCGPGGERFLYGNQHKLMLKVTQNTTH